MPACPISICAAANKKDLGLFYALSETAGYTGEEAGYLRRFAPRPDEEHACLLAFAGEKPVARLYTWTQRALNRAEGRRGAFFSLLDGEREGFAPLLQAAEEMWRQRGCGFLSGPMAPDGSGLFMGQCDSPRESGGVFTGPRDAGQTQALRNAGFAVSQRWKAFALDVPRENRYAPYAQKLRARLGLRIRPMGRGFFSYSLSRAAYETADFAPAQNAVQAQKLLPFSDARLSFAALDSRGHCLGYALTLKGERPRLVTFLTRDVPIRRAVTLCLTDALCEAAQRSGVKSALLGVIDAENRPSLNLARGLGAREVCEYVRYYKKIT